MLVLLAALAMPVVSAVGLRAAGTSAGSSSAGTAAMLKAYMARSHSQRIPLRPRLLAPNDIPRGQSFLSTGSRTGSESRSHAQMQTESQLTRAGAGSAFQPSAEFTGSARESSELDTAGALPWGVGSPRAGDSLPNFHYSNMPFMDFPKEIEYSLESGDNIQTFSSAKQDIKLITQVFENVTNGFYLDTHAGFGEEGSNTLLLELTGWRGLCLEPHAYKFATLWSKFRKAWLFLGAISPNENATKLGFTHQGKIDMLSGHMIHAYPMTAFLSEMGGRKTVDFWSLKNGGYEAEVLNETLLGSGKSIEFGVILVSFSERISGRGAEPFVQMRSKDETEQMVFEIMHNASYVYIGGLDAYWINHVTPRYNWKDAVFVNPRYFEKRGIPTPWKVKSAPPPPLNFPLGNQSWLGYDSWDSGYSTEEETDKVIAYIAKAKKDAAATEPTAKAHRKHASKILH